MKASDTNRIIKKLADYQGESHYLSKEDREAIINQINDSPSSSITADVLDALQHYGIDTNEKAEMFIDTIMTCFWNTTNVDIAYLCLYHLSSAVTYTHILDAKDILEITSEDREFNRESRYYKGAKSDFITHVLNEKSYEDTWSAVYNWISKIISTDDDEYNTLLAFCLTNSGIKIPGNIIQQYKDYLLNHSTSESSQEVKKLVAHATS